MARLLHRWFTAALTLAAIGVAACGDDNGGDVRTVTVAPAETSAQETSTSAPVSGDAILIETRVTNAKRHTGEVLDASVIGESAFCRGGKTSGGSEGPTITTTFRCPGGTLKVHYAPTQNARSRAPSGRSLAAPAASRVCAGAARWWPGSRAKIRIGAGRPLPARSGNRASAPCASPGCERAGGSAAHDRSGRSAGVSSGLAPALALTRIRVSCADSRHA